MKRIVLIFVVLMPLFILQVKPLSAGTITGKVAAAGVQDPRNVVVYIDEIPGKEFPPSKEPVVMNQKGMEFIPHVLPIVKGTTVGFLNSDTVPHNVFTPDKIANKFNLGTWPIGETRSYTFDKEGEVVLLCLLHPEMEAWAVVRQNPFFVVTDQTGIYKIENVPAGSYTLKTWHKKLKLASQQVSVPQTGDVSVNFSLKR